MKSFEYIFKVWFMYIKEIFFVIVGNNILMVKEDNLFENIKWERELILF